MPLRDLTSPMQRGMLPRAMSSQPHLNRIRELRLAMGREGWTQERLARVARVSLGTISRLETGERMPSLLVANRIAKALGVSPEEVWPDLPEAAAV